MPFFSRFTWVANLALAGASVIVVLAVAELVLRLTGIRFDASLYGSDPTLGWVLRPGAHGWNVSEGESYVEINSDGQRDRERSATKPPSGFRIAILGDSMVEARQVDLTETFAARTEGLLANCPALHDRHVEILNFGVPGYGTAQELLLLRSKVWKYRPDLVILSVYLGNDLFDNYRALDYTSPELRPYFILTDRGLVLRPPEREVELSDTRRAFARNVLANTMNRSRVLLLINTARNRLTKIDNATRVKAEESAVGGIPLNYPAAWPYMPAETDARLAEAWKTTEALILSVRDEVRIRGADLVVTYIPMSRQIDPNPGALASARREIGVENLRYPNERLERFASRNGMDFLDLSRPLQERALREGAYLNRFRNQPGGGHFNELGHRAIAEALSGHICGRLMKLRATGAVGLRNVA
jgi:hypothetical protein